MQEYRTNITEFKTTTTRRVVMESCVLLLLLVYFWSGFSESLPGWLEVSILVVVSVYILFGLANYPKARSIAQAFYIRLLDDGLGFPFDGKMKQIPYDDLIITKIKKSNDRVIEIGLKTSFGQTLRLRNLENMNELHNELVDHIKD